MFKPGWKISFFVVLLLPILLLLGNWQLERAEEKQRLLTAQSQLMSRPPERLSGQLMPDYSPVVLIGFFDSNKYFLLDNKVVGGRVGFDVISPFYDESGVVVLVNRGWVQGSYDRVNLPKVVTPSQRVILSGTIGRNLSEPFLLEPDQQGDEWPVLVQSINLPFMAKALDKNLPDFFVRLDSGSEGAYKIHYQVVNVLPEKHKAYAVQWFAMSIALVVLYLLLGFGKLRSGRGD